MERIRYRPRAWAYLKAEIARRLGDEAMAELWAGYTHQTKIDHLHAHAQMWRTHVQIAEAKVAAIEETTPQPGDGFAALAEALEAGDV